MGGKKCMRCGEPRCQLKNTLCGGRFHKGSKTKSNCGKFLTALLLSATATVQEQANAKMLLETHAQHWEAEEKRKKQKQEDGFVYADECAAPQCRIHVTFKGRTCPEHTEQRGRLEEQIKTGAKSEAFLTEFERALLLTKERDAESRKRSALLRLDYDIGAGKKLKEDREAVVALAFDDDVPLEESAIILEQLRFDLRLTPPPPAPEGRRGTIMLAIHCTDLHSNYALHLSTLGLRAKDARIVVNWYKLITTQDCPSIHLQFVFNHGTYKGAKMAFIKYEDAREDDEDDDVDYDLNDYIKTSHSRQFEGPVEIHNLLDEAAAFDDAVEESRWELRNARVQRPIELLEILARKLEPFVLGREYILVIRRMYRANKAAILKALRSGDVYVKAVKSAASDYLPWTRLFGLGSSHRRSDRLDTDRLRNLLSSPYLMVLFMVVYAMMDGYVAADAEIPLKDWGVGWEGADCDIFNFMLQMLRELNVCSDRRNVNDSLRNGKPYFHLRVTGFSAYKFAVLAAPVIEDNIDYCCLWKYEKLKLILHQTDYKELAISEGFQGLEGH